MTEKPRGDQNAAIGDHLTVDVGMPVAGGQCIARVDGRVVFVRDAIPGERVEVEVTGTGKRGGFLRADTRQVIVASPHRVTPPCSVASECGGCDWQYVAVDFQRQLKEQVIIDAFKRTGGIAAIGGVPLADAFVVEPLDAGNGLGWRTRMRYAVTSTGEIGLRAARSHRVIPAAQCPLADERIRRSLAGHVAPPGARALIAAVPGGRPGGMADTRTGADCGAGPGSDADTGTHTGTADSAVLITDQQMDACDVPVIEERVGERRFRVAAAGFWQVHPLAASALVEAVLRAAAVRPGDRVLDLYSGAGLFAAFLAEATGVTGRVDAVECDKIAVGSAKSNLADLPWVHHHRADVHRWLSRGTRRSADVVVLDPSRAGAGKTVVEAVVVREPRTIVYVACDAVALARDAGYFAGHGYEMTSLRAFDLFPMTKHVECVATFTPTAPVDPA